MGSVYLIVNKVSLKSYVGITTVPIRLRFYGHTRADCNAPLTRAIRKYGLDSFDACLLEERETLQELREREKYWIATLGTKTPDGYNITEGGGGTPGAVRSEEFCIRQSLARKGENNPNYGNHSPWSDARRDASKRPEVIAKQSESMKRAWARSPWTTRKRELRGIKQ